VATAVVQAACPLHDVGQAKGQPLVPFSAKAQSADGILQMLLPAGWTLQDHSHTHVPVEVHANTAWRDALAGIADQSGACVVLDWDAHVLRVQPQAAPAIDTTALMDNPVKVDHPAQLAASPDTAPLAPLPQGMLGDVGATLNFDLRIGETLRAALTRWAEQAGWALVWQTDVDYQIQAAAQFPAGTSFKDALRQTMQAFWQQTRWLQATVYKNHVVVVQGQGRSAE
jgi:hypothetical protein